MEFNRWIFRKNFTTKQKLIQWFWYIIRALVEILGNIVSLVTLGFIQTWWGLEISEIILRNSLKFYEQNKEKYGHNN